MLGFGAIGEVALAEIPSIPASGDVVNKGVTNVYPFPALDGGGWFKEWDRPKRRHSPETLARLLNQQRSHLEDEHAKLQKRVDDYNALPLADRLRQDLSYLQELLAKTTDRRERREIQRRLDQVRTQIWRESLQ